MSKKKLSKLLVLYLLCGNWLAGHQSGRGVAAAVGKELGDKSYH